MEEKQRYNLIDEEQSRRSLKGQELEKVLREIEEYIEKERHNTTRRPLMISEIKIGCMAYRNVK